jgi:hypothetical protein
MNEAEKRTSMETTFNEFNDDDETLRILFKHRFYSTVIGDILKSFENGAFTGSMVQALCCLDYLGLALSLDLNNHTSKDFKKYLMEYMGMINSKYAEYSNEIYAIRCALIHTYGIAKATNEKVYPYFIYNSSELSGYKHLDMSNEKQLTICISIFIADLIISIENFINISSIENLKKWEGMLLIPKRIELVIDRMHIRESKIFDFNKIHFFLKDFDCNMKLSDLRKSLIKALDSKLH